MVRIVLGTSGRAGDVWLGEAKMLVPVLVPGEIKSWM